MLGKEWDEIKLDLVEVATVLATSHLSTDTSATRGTD